MPDEQPTHMSCPKTWDGSSHHMVPKPSGRNAIGEQMHVLVCQYCGKTAKELTGKRP